MNTNDILMIYINRNTFDQVLQETKKIVLDFKIDEEIFVHNCSDEVDYKYKYILFGSIHSEKSANTSHYFALFRFIDNEKIVYINFYDSSVIEITSNEFSRYLNGNDIYAKDNIFSHITHL